MPPPLCELCSSCLSALTFNHHWAGHAKLAVRVRLAKQPATTENAAARRTARATEIGPSLRTARRVSYRYVQEVKHQCAIPYWTTGTGGQPGSLSAERAGDSLIGVRDPSSPLMAQHQNTRAGGWEVSGCRVAAEPTPTSPTSAPCILPPPPPVPHQA